MGFLVINEHTGEVMFDKIYPTEGEAQLVINQRLEQDDLVSKGEEGLVVVPMPSAKILKRISEGSWYTTMRNAGRHVFPPLEFDCDCDREGDQ